MCASAGHLPGVLGMWASTGTCPCLPSHRPMARGDSQGVEVSYGYSKPQQTQQPPCQPDWGWGDLNQAPLLLEPRELSPGAAAAWSSTGLRWLAGWGRHKSVRETSVPVCVCVYTQMDGSVHGCMHARLPLPGALEPSTLNVCSDPRARSPMPTCLPAAAGLGVWGHTPSVTFPFSPSCAINVSN